MREILFRGKREDTGEWVYGYYVQADEEHYIFTGKTGLSQTSPVHCLMYRDFVRYEVVPETVGQYTGLKDESDKRIFEGDVVKVYYSGIGCGENLGVYETAEEITGVIEYGNYGLVIEKMTDKNGKWRDYTGYNQGEGWTNVANLWDIYDEQFDDYSIEVIGNIHDTPELLMRKS